MRQIHGVQPWKSDDPDSERVWWEDAGVHQNLTFPVQPDPVSGQHCWHQKVTVTRPGPDDRYGDVVVDTNRSFEVYREWLAKARPAPGAGQSAPSAVAAARLQAGRVRVSAGVTEIRCGRQSA